jgi:hypothetical protein
MPGQTNTKCKHVNVISEFFDCCIFLTSPALFVQKIEVVWGIVGSVGISQNNGNFVSISKNLGI